MAEPLIDVLIPVFNGAPWLRESIASIQRQTHAALRIHVVDDGSTDSTPHILADIQAGDSRVHVHRQDNAGIVDALNHGLRYCDADWLARHDADDVALPQRLQRQLEYIMAYPDCVAVGAKARHIDGAGRPLGSVTELRPPEQADFDWMPAREPYLMHPFMLARRAAITAVGGYRHASHSEDSDLYWRLRERGRLHNLDAVLGDYRMHEASISSGSIVNGRLMAIGSQLAALSARRRAHGRADLAFDKSDTALRRRVVTLQAMAGLAGGVLDANERDRFELAISAKLLELAGYLPYELDPDDCRFIGRALARHGSRAGNANRRALTTQVARAAVRLCVAGRPRDAARLLRPAAIPEFIGRLVWTNGVPPRVRTWWHRLFMGASS